MLNCFARLPTSPSRKRISGTLHLAERNEFRFFSFYKYQKILFYFGCWLSVCPKMMALPDSGREAAAPAAPPARTPMLGAAVCMQLPSQALRTTFERERDSGFEVQNSRRLSVL